MAALKSNWVFSAESLLSMLNRVFVVNVESSLFKGKKTFANESEIGKSLIAKLSFQIFNQRTRGGAFVESLLRLKCFHSHLQKTIFMFKRDVAIFNLCRKLDRARNYCVCA